MARTPNHHPTDGELELLQILWQAGPSSLGNICASLREHRPIATTTVATMLGVMLEKGLVLRRKGTHGYLWSAKTTRQNAAAGMIRKLVDVVFDGSAQRLVAHLLESGEIDDKDRKDLRRLIAEESKRKQ
jgi:BlaI family transcriptional regulator, penicillinase repressor